MSAKMCAHAGKLCKHTVYWTLFLKPSRIELYIGQVNVIFDVIMSLLENYSKYTWKSIHVIVKNLDKYILQTTISDTMFRISYAMFPAYGCSTDIEPC